MDSLKFKKLASEIKEVYNCCIFDNYNYDYFEVTNSKISNLYSLTKNIVSLCIGILIDQGKLNIKDDISKFFIDEYENAVSYSGTTVEDVLMQVTGIERGFLDIDAEDPKTFPSDDYLKIIFDRGLCYKDKKHFVYSDSNYYLLGRLVGKISGVSLDKFIEENIFKPLEIKNYDFQYCPMGYQMGATGVFLNSIDVCKIASIFMYEGKYKDKVIVSKKYIDEAKKVKVIVDENTGYGYSIWINRNSNLRHGSGMWGQMFVIRDDKIYCFLSLDKEGKTAPLITELLKGE